jgi:hypothetical protein
MNDIGLSLILDLLHRTKEGRAWHYIGYWIKLPTDIWYLKSKSLKKSSWLREECFCLCTCRCPSLVFLPTSVSMSKSLCQCPFSCDLNINLNRKLENEHKHEREHGHIPKNIRLLGYCVSPISDRGKYFYRVYSKIWTRNWISDCSVRSSSFIGIEWNIDYAYIVHQNWNKRPLFDKTLRYRMSDVGAHLQYGCYKYVLIWCAVLFRLAVHSVQLLLDQPHRVHRVLALSALWYFAQ